MSKRFYRIRNLEKLLNEYNELENQEIFFQSSEKLNDPLEGFYDKVFSNIEKWRKEHWKKYHQNMLIKTRDWAYEKEYRIIYSALQDYEIEISQRKLKYDFNCLKGIIFGIKTPLEKKCEIIEIIKKKCKENDRTDFEFYQACFCHSDKNIQHRNLNIKLW